MESIQKQLRNIPKEDRKRILAALERLAVRDHADMDCQRLKGYKHIYRIRVGDYRIIYFDDGKEIILKAIRRRNERTYSDF